MLLAGLAALPRLGRAQDGAKPLTAGAVIERIKANVGVDWADQTVDKIIAGSADAPVKGIATTMMATLDVVQRAAAAGLNFVVTHEPTFYSHLDTVEELADDATYRFKDEVLRRHDMVVFRFHDHWHRRRPDGIAVGMQRELGWQSFVSADNPRLFVMPQTTLADVALHIASRLKADTVRVVGDPQLPVRRVRANWGYSSLEGGIRGLSDPEADVYICGEAREWEVVEYTQDRIASGEKKGLIVIGHIASEQAGMKYCAEWLEAFVPEVPVKFIAAGEPFWSPAA